MKPGRDITVCFFHWKDAQQRVCGFHREQTADTQSPQHTVLELEPTLRGQSTLGALPPTELDTWGAGRNAVGSWKVCLASLCLLQEQNPLSTRREEDRTNLAPEAYHLTIGTNNVLSTFVPLWVEFVFVLPDLLVCFSIAF